MLHFTTTFNKTCLTVEMLKLVLYGIRDIPRKHIAHGKAKLHPVLCTHCIVREFFLPYSLFVFIELTLITNGCD